MIADGHWSVLSVNIRVIRGWFMTVSTDALKGSTPMRMYDVIQKKRDGGELSTEELQFFIKGYTEGTVPDYQAAALLMAIFLKGLNTRETGDLTQAMMHSGDVIDLSPIAGVKVDKHSTGGVGDTTTLVLAPLVAACGIPVAKMSGRGLGHTGGTIDKLESVEGFHTELDTETFIRNVNEKKIAVIGQSKNIAPADKKIYALRDVTATVHSIPLIASSVMSKKLAAGSDAIVLDVKVGSGAFMRTFEEAAELARQMVGIGSHMSRETVAVITSMDEPLGLAVGNALEVKEAIDTLRGHGPEDLTELCLRLGAYMVWLGKGADTLEAAGEKVAQALRSGAAYEKFIEFITAQGGSAAQVRNPELLPQASLVREIKAETAGYVAHIQSDEVGISAMMLGAGREDLDSIIDLSAGIMLAKKVGDAVAPGDVLAVFHTNRPEKLQEAERRFRSAYRFSETPVTPAPIIKAVVTAQGTTVFDAQV